MTTQARNGMAQVVGTASTRRGFLRLLGGAALAGTLAAVDQSASARTLGKRRKRQQHAKRRQDTRPSDTSSSVPILLGTEWVLSGGPDPSTPITGADDLEITAEPDRHLDEPNPRSAFTYRDGNGEADTHAPIVFPAQVGDNLYIYVDKYDQTCQPPTLWLHSVRLGQGRELTEWRRLLDPFTEGCPATVTFSIDTRI